MSPQSGKVNNHRQQQRECKQPSNLQPKKMASHVPGRSGRSRKTPRPDVNSRASHTFHNTRLQRRQSVRRQSPFHSQPRTCLPPCTPRTSRSRAPKDTLQQSPSTILQYNRRPRHGRRDQARASQPAKHKHKHKPYRRRAVVRNLRRRDRTAGPRRVCDHGASRSRLCQIATCSMMARMNRGCSDDFGVSGVLHSRNPCQQSTVRIPVEWVREVRALQSILYLGAFLEGCAGVDGSEIWQFERVLGLLSVVHARHSAACTVLYCLYPSLMTRA